MPGEDLLSSAYCSAVVCCCRLLTDGASDVPAADEHIRSTTLGSSFSRLVDSKYTLTAFHRFLSSDTTHGDRLSDRGRAARNSQLTARGYSVRVEAMHIHLCITSPFRRVAHARRGPAFQSSVMKCASSCLAAAVRDCLRAAELLDHLSAHEVKVRAGVGCGMTTQTGHSAQ